MPAESIKESGKLIRFGKGIVFAARREERSSRLGRAGNYLSDFMNDLRAFFLAKRNRYDLVVVKDKYFSALTALLAARIYGMRFCFWLAYPHAEANLYGARERIVRYPVFYWFRGIIQHFILYRIILPLADHAFVQSDQMLDDINKKGVPREKMTPVPGSLILSAVPYKADADPGPRDKSILYVGTLIQERKLDFLIRVMARISARHSDAKLVLVGAGENPDDERRIRDEMSACGIDASRVEFCGRVAREQVWRYIEEATICLSPYSPSFILNSTSPTKLIEYMAMGRPVVANEHPEQLRVLEDSNAGVCVPWDEDAFARCIDALLDDPEECRKMGLRGRQWVVENRSSEVMADIVESSCRKVLGDKQVSNTGGK